MCDIIKCVCGCVCIPICGLAYSAFWLCSPSFREMVAEKKREEVEKFEKMREKIERAEASLQKIKEMRELYAKTEQDKMDSNA